MSRNRSRSPRRDDSYRQIRNERAEKREATEPSTRPHKRVRHHAPASAEGGQLPFGASPLHKRDLAKFEALFSDYLDIQKQLAIQSLPSDEVKGRWKSFLGKWNRGELAAGWYDPETLIKARKRYSDRQAGQPSSEVADFSKTKSASQVQIGVTTHQPEEDSDEEDSHVGPSLPDVAMTRHGPTIPGFQDLQQRDELVEEASYARRAALRREQKSDRQQQKDRLEEMAPKEAPGSRERQLQKRQDRAATNREFRDAKDNREQEIGENELMGGGDGVDEFKARLQDRERLKNEREVRKEELLRARASEREEKLRVFRAKEEKTMDMLKALAAQRFGAPQT